MKVCLQCGQEKPLQEYRERHDMAGKFRRGTCRRCENDIRAGLIKVKPRENRETLMDRGYAWVFRPEHPRANKKGYVKRSIFNYEEYYGVNVPKGMEMHHLDYNRGNDDPTNLVLLFKREHHSLWLPRKEELCTRSPTKRKLV